jgi:hypothetical protein
MMARKNELIFSGQLGNMTRPISQLSPGSDLPTIEKPRCASRVIRKGPCDEAFTAYEAAADAYAG